jgi:bla regulator protein BlaR1
MIAPWLLYATMLGALLGGAALALTRLARAGRMPTRWVWFAALALAVVLPIVANFIAAPATQGSSIVKGSSRGVSAIPVDTLVLTTWAAASMLMIARLVAALVMLRRGRRTWREAAIDGTPVLLTESLGPALVGLARPRPAIPSWALRLEPHERALILLHEAEHARAGDPWLLASGAAAIAVMPWNPALWWLVRRLRLAIEIDCDARVLRSGADTRAYATLLLAVGERKSRSPFAWATALAEPRSFLERRILAMTTPAAARRSFLAIALPGAAAALAVIIACEAPLPDQVLPASSVAAAPPPGTVTVAGQRVELTEQPRLGDTLSVLGADGVERAGRLYRVLRDDAAGTPETVENLHVEPDGRVGTVTAEVKVRGRLLRLTIDTARQRAGEEIRPLPRR